MFGIMRVRRVDNGRGKRINESGTAKSKLIDMRRVGRPHWVDRGYERISIKKTAADVNALRRRKKVGEVE